MDNSTMFANLRQDLLEQIGEWLDSQTVTTEEILAGIHGDPNEDDELHIKMADAAMKVYAESRELVFASFALDVAGNRPMDKIPAEETNGCGMQSLKMRQG